VLRHDPAPEPDPVPAPDVDGPSPQATLAAASSVLGVEPPVTVEGRTRLKGAPRDPFAGAVTQEGGASSSSGGDAGSPGGTRPSSGGGAASASASTGSAASTATSSPASSGSASGSSGSASAPRVVDPAPAPAPAPKPRPQPTDDPTVYRLLRADVRFDGEALHDVVRLRPFPGARAPVALYLGPITGGRGAAFVISGGVEVAGDGRCRPTRRLCTHLILWPGERATLTTPDGTRHALQLLRVRVDRTTSRTAAERFYTRQSERGRCVLDVLDYLGFDAETGTVAPHHDARECEYVIGDDGEVGAR
ncbi:MAG TPA: hypothetical protein VFR97_04405, partial [Capillimicrobium sp.]|nr:hypothetical protein [Capillimicrobium sp.]